ncbi:glutathione S-transferase, N-terminal domain containing protein [Nitzschia inconspicua]|uniref:Glutathione S-transferase, N-terminal domain containing protein n=1 Tax=Nitzschia inconspicua TaxID=303405 RepID=A0A9K3LA40_9STRA|nr:glutathione S-transferase, N-terminal domain containing protein [Nitzschia inconspicua]
MKRKYEQQPRLKLYYFDIKGKGEPIRLLCAYAGIDIEDYRFVTRDEFLAMREGTRLPFSQVPMLEVDGKHSLVQSCAIMRYLGKLGGLYPVDPIQAAKVDALMEQETDTFIGTTVLTYGRRFGIDLTPDVKEKSYEQISDEVLPGHFRNIEKCLRASPTGWLAATDEPSPADFMWYVKLSLMAEKKELSEKIRTLEDFPKIRALMEKFESLTPVQEYYASKDDHLELPDIAVGKP